MKYDLIFEAADYLWKLNEFFKLPLTVKLIPNARSAMWLAQYEATWIKHKANERYGTISINTALNLDRSKEEVFETVRHEMAHAICDIRYKIKGGHCATWIRVAKLLRVKTRWYENQIDKATIGSA